MLWEPRVTLSGGDWLLIAGLGLGPMGIAFYTWDASLKTGDPRLIGALSYATPVLSTAVLTAFAAPDSSAAGGTSWSWRLTLALACIVGGAVVSAWAGGRRQR